VQILQLESGMTEKDLDRDKHMKAARHAKEKLAENDRDRKELNDEYIALKANFLANSSQLDKEVLYYC